MQVETQGDKKASNSTFVNPFGWIAIMSVAAILYYQFPKSRGYIGGVIGLVVLGLVLSRYTTITSQIKSIVRG